MEGEIPQQDQAQGYVAPQVVGTTAISSRTILNVSSWLLLFLLAPATILVLISQNTIPGNFFYPVKRGLENTVLVAASVNPTTKAFFRVDLQARRFSEAEKLLLAKADAAALSDFITEIQQTQAAVAQVSDPVKKQELQQKLQEAYSEYEKRLVAVRVQLETKQQIPPSESTQPQVIPSPTVRPTNTPVPPAATSIPTRAPLPSNGAVASSTPPPPTAVPTEIPPTPVSPTGGPTPVPQQPANTGGAVDATIAYLQCLRTRPAHECTPPPTAPTPQPTPTTQPERERGRQTREERGERDGRHEDRREPRSTGRERERDRD